MYAMWRSTAGPSPSHRDVHSTSSLRADVSQNAASGAPALVKTAGTEGGLNRKKMANNEFASSLLVGGRHPFVSVETFHLKIIRQPTRHEIQCEPMFCFAWLILQSYLAMFRLHLPQKWLTPISKLQIHFWRTSQGSIKPKRTQKHRRGEYNLMIWPKWGSSYYFTQTPVTNANGNFKLSIQISTVNQAFLQMWVINITRVWKSAVAGSR